MPSSRNSRTDSENRRDWKLAPRGNFWRATFTAMGSPCELLCETNSAAEAESLTEIVATEAWRIEDKFSRYLDGNIVDRINTANGSTIEVDDETARFIDYASELFAVSEGRFDITSGALRQVWTFDGSDRIPSESDILKVLQHVGWNRVTWRKPELTMPAGMQVDFGGIGKEYAVDRAVRFLQAESSANCLVNYGGDLAVTSPPKSQPDWQIGLESTKTPWSVPASLIQLRTGAIATSGDARRYLVKDGIRYGHILDPTTGWPVAGAPTSVTVAGDTCIQAGVFCTLAMLAGEGAEAMLDSEEVRYWCVRP